MKLKTLASLLLAVSGTIATSASAQSYGNTSLNIGGGYSNTNWSGSRGNGRVESYGFGGNIGVNSGYNNGGYGGMPYGGGMQVMPYYGGYCPPTYLPVYNGCAPVFVPYSPFTNSYGNPCYGPILPPCGQFMIR